MKPVSLGEAKNVGVVGSVLALIMPIIGWVIGPILMAITIKKVDEAYMAKSFRYYLLAITISFVGVPIYLFYSNSTPAYNSSFNLLIESWFFIPAILFFISFYKIGRVLKKVSFIITGILIVLTVVAYVFLVNDYNNDPFKGGDFGAAGIGIVMLPLLIICLISQIVSFARLAMIKE